MADENTTPDDGAQGNTENGNGTDENNTPSFLETLPEGMRTNEALTGFENAGQLAQAHLDSLANKPATPDVPENANGYAFENVPPEFEGTGNTEFIGQLAHEAGLDKATAQKVFDGLAKAEAERLKAEAAQKEKADKVLAEKEKALADDWGGQADLKRGQARAAILSLGGENLDKMLESAGLLKHPDVLRAFYSVSSHLKEAKMETGDGIPPKGRAMTQAGNPILYD